MISITIASRKQESVQSALRTLRSREVSSETFNPAGRWKNSYTPENLAMFEGLVGGTLEELGYELGTTDRRVLNRASLKRMRATYRKYFDSKLYLKAKTPLGKLLVTRDLSWI